MVYGRWVYNAHLSVLTPTTLSISIQNDNIDSMCGIFNRGNECLEASQ